MKRKAADGKGRRKRRTPADHDRNRRGADRALGASLRSWEAAEDRGDRFGSRLMDSRVKAAARDTAKMRPKYDWPW